MVVLVLKVTMKVSMMVVSQFFNLIFVIVLEFGWLDAVFKHLTGSGRGLMMWRFISHLAIKQAVYWIKSSRKCSSFQCLDLAVAAIISSPLARPCQPHPLSRLGSDLQWFSASCGECNRASSVSFSQQRFGPVSNRRHRFRFEYSDESRSAFVELAPQFFITPDDYKRLLESVPGVSKVEWNTYKSSYQGNACLLYTSPSPRDS